LYPRCEYQRFGSILQLYRDAQVLPPTAGSATKAASAASPS
jgi:hypothetical protein